MLLSLSLRHKVKKLFNSIFFPPIAIKEYVFIADSKGEGRRDGGEFGKGDTGLGGQVADCMESNATSRSTA